MELTERMVKETGIEVEGSAHPADAAHRRRLIRDVERVTEGISRLVEQKTGYEAELAKIAERAGETRTVFIPWQVVGSLAEDYNFGAGKPYEDVDGTDAAPDVRDALLELGYATEGEYCKLLPTAEAAMLWEQIRPRLWELGLLT